MAGELTVVEAGVANVEPLSGAHQVSEYQIVLALGRRRYRVRIWVEHPSTVPPVHGERSTAAPTVRGVEICCVPSGAGARGQVRRRLETVARQIALAAHTVTP